MRVGIVGSGISGVTLGLQLQQLGVDTTLLCDRTAAEQRVGRLENLVARFPATRDRERQLGVAHWDDVAECGSQGIDVDVVGTPLSFLGRCERPAQGVDFRVYVARLVEDYLARGGRLMVGPLPATPTELVARAADHDVIVVAAGRSSGLAASLFAVRTDRSPYSRPQRRLLGGLYTGVAATDPPAVCFNVVPGVGEIFQQPFLTDRGIVAAMLVEAVPGGPLEPITRLDVAADPAGFAHALLNVLGTFAPKLAARVDAAHFGLLGPRDVLQGAITPTVRAGWTTLPDSRLALAIGDAWIVNDPITGQGANIGSYCAWRTAHALHAADRVDAAFAGELEDELWSYAGPVTAWTNAWLQPPPEHILGLLAAATAHQPVADAFANGFADPVRFAADLATPDAAAAFTRRNLELAGV
jgi:hypothetical protein